MNRRAFLGATAGSLTAFRVAATPNSSLRSKIVGVWTLTEAATLNGNEATPWFGRTNPVSGLLMYADNGWMSVQISGSRPEKISREEYLSLSDSAKFVWLKEYYGYYGTYEVDEINGKISHRVVESLTAYERSTPLVRQIVIEGDTLTSLTEPRASSGGNTFNRLIWKRAPQA